MIADSTPICARAHANIALIKYWGKRDAALNLPAVGSISITLADLYTETALTWHNAATDTATLDGQPVESKRISHVMDLIRALADTDQRAAVTSTNNFPTGAGLASSASGFAALVVSASAAAGLELSTRELSILARQGSGSAARSIEGGFVEMHRGHRADGTDAYAAPLADKDSWPLEVVVAITTRAQKAVDSTTGMTDTATRSDFFDAWVAGADGDLDAAREAIANRDFDALGALSERSCLKMHGLMLSTGDGLIYWSSATVAAIHEVRKLRAEGVPVYFTIDAGPQVKALCAPGYGAMVAERLGAVVGVEAAQLMGLGPAAHVIA
ncbi:diphosphomevalonate decarboxylase [Salinisphaera orenii]|uniref:diphosphomevalonate decarboxylase n=1 Tax=Salinisphaera orenii TaxID=856731 RepID=UPI000DBE73A6